MKYVNAYNRAYRLTRIFCALTGIKRNSDQAREVYDAIWYRTASESR